GAVGWAKARTLRAVPTKPRASGEKWCARRANARLCTPYGALALKLRHSREQPLDILGPRQAVVAVLHQGEHHVVLRKARAQFDSVRPRHVRALDAPQAWHRGPGVA